MCLIERLDRILIGPRFILHEFIMGEVQIEIKEFQVREGVGNSSNNKIGPANRPLLEVVVAAAAVGHHEEMQRVVPV